MQDEYTSYSPEVAQIRDHIFSTAEEAVYAIRERQSDAELVKRVSKMLNHDIPDHFRKNSPIFYLSRYIATPNFEFQKVAGIAKQHGLPLVLGEDLKSTFVGSNELKRKLGKLTVITGKNSNDDEMFENFTILDFSAAQGRNICDNQTLRGLSLCEFHHKLFNEFTGDKFEYVDESDWVDRNHRDNIKEQYKKMLSLLCVHGIMLESYPPDEHDFLEDVVYPSFKEVEQEIGCKPLIVEHISDEEELERDWNAYPKECYSFIANQIT